ncbi:MAG: DUF1684 domain-containing protein [Halanaeroarchaeum sp.]
MPESEFDESAWRERVQAYRREKDDFFATDEDSPLPAERREDFEGLAYFDLDPNYRVVARLQAVRDPEAVELPTNRGPDVEFERVATLGFSLHGDHHVLAAFRTPGQRDLLVPFNDETNGTETARDGRYLALEVGDLATGMDVVVDFNLAYHPFCVYDEDYVAALPPEENELSIAVRAGERR